MVRAENEVVFEVWPRERKKGVYQLMRWFRFGVSFHYRHRKNYSLTKGVLTILGRFLYRLVGSPIKLLFLPWRIFINKGKKSVKALIADSVTDIAYALGCIAPFFGIRLKQYY